MADEMSVLNPDDVAAIATGFLSKAENVRKAVRYLIDSNSSYTASAAMVAGEFAIRDAMTEIDKAFILRCKKQRKLLVEGGSSPSDDAILDVVAEAAAKQLRFPSREFSVWTNGTLYVKEDGFRQLLMLEGWSAIDTHIQPPKWVKLQDKSNWECVAKASARRGASVEIVECVVPVNGHATDTGEKIVAHATRSILKRLYKKCSTIQIEFEGEDDSAVIDVVAEQQAAPRVIEQRETSTEPIPEPSKADKFKATWFAELKGIKDPAKGIASKIKHAWEGFDVQAIERIALEELPTITDTKQRDNLRRYIDAAGAYIMESNEANHER